MQGFSGWFWGLCHYLDSPLHRCALNIVQAVCWYIDICAMCIVQVCEEGRSLRCECGDGAA